MLSYHEALNKLISAVAAVSGLPGYLSNRGLRLLQSWRSVQQTTPVKRLNHTP